MSKWDTQTIQEEALKYTTRTAFAEGSQTAYKAAREHDLGLSAFCKHMEKGGKWRRSKVLQEAKRYLSRTEFSTLCRGAYMAARRNGWLDEACQHMTRKTPSNR